MVKCPETIEELEALERMLPLCRKDLTRMAEAKLASGAARTEREAARQLAEETGRPQSAIRAAIHREKEQLHNLVAAQPPCTTPSQAEVSCACNLEIDAAEDGEEPEDPQTCRYCRDFKNFDDMHLFCWRHRRAVYVPDSETCDDWRHCDDDEEEAEDRKIVLATLHTGDHESYTPARYVEAAREVMWSIELDPASTEQAQEIVQAKVFYTKEANGLDKPWEGNIFLNPPYSHSEIKHFVDKLLAELKPGQQAILLTNNNTDTTFFHNAARRPQRPAGPPGVDRHLRLGPSPSPSSGP